MVQGEDIPGEKNVENEPRYIESVKKHAVQNEADNFDNICLTSSHLAKYIARVIIPTKIRNSIVSLRF